MIVLHGSFFSTNAHLNLIQAIKRVYLLVIGGSVRCVLMKVSGQFVLRIFLLCVE